MVEKLSTMLLFVLAIHLWIGTFQENNNSINYFTPTIERNLSKNR